MSKKDVRRQTITSEQVVFNPLGCPFREFKDSELGSELWGLGPEEIAARMTQTASAKAAVKAPTATGEGFWIDDQVQPLPRSARAAFDRWARPEELMDTWSLMEVPVNLVVVKEVMGNELSTMKAHEIQNTYVATTSRSSFCRRVLSICYILERVQDFVVENQSENFVFSTGNDGWLPRFHIYSPGMKPGGGIQHKPVLSKNGCYMVRLYYNGAWRCIWVSDAIPVDSKGTALLPFALSPQSAPPSAPVKAAKPPPAPPRVVQLWPLLICKALLKLSAIDMTTVDEIDEDEDENVENTNFLHFLTGCLTMKYTFNDSGSMWQMLCKEVDMFSWDEVPDEKLSSVAKSGKGGGGGPKKAVVKDNSESKRKAFICIELNETGDVPSYELPSLTPAYEMPMLVVMVRDLPLIKPPDEPEIPLWKTYRWIYWARQHGLYEDYECPRKKWLKTFALLRLSKAMHLLDVRSTPSITNVNAVNLDNAKVMKAQQETKETLGSKKSAMSLMQANVMEYKEWSDYEMLFRHVSIVKQVNLPSMHNTLCAGNTLEQPSALVGGKPSSPEQSMSPYMHAPSDTPIFVQIDSAIDTRLFISLSTIHPNILVNARRPPQTKIKQAQLLLETMQWLAGDGEDPLKNAVAYLETSDYESCELKYPAGRYSFRLWVSSSMLWNTCLMTEANLFLSRRGEAMHLASTECVWATDVLSNISNTFLNWIKSMQGRSIELARTFYMSYSPDKEWNTKEIGYPQKMVHWMFGKAFARFLHQNLEKSLVDDTFFNLRNLFIDPYFGSVEPPEPSVMCQMLDRCKCFKQDSTTTVVLHSDKCPGSSVSLKANIEDPTPRKERFLFKYVEGKQCLGPCNTHQIPCGIVNSEMLVEMEINRAAQTIQSYWRRFRCKRIFLQDFVSPEFFKTMSDLMIPSSNMTKLMNIFFTMFPNVRSAYSLSSAIGDIYGYAQYSGSYVANSRDSWMPLFMGAFYCHSPTRVQFDLECHLLKRKLVVYDNDAKTKLDVDVTSQRNYDLKPNVFGYDVHGHAWRNSSTQPYSTEEIPWKLTIISSQKGSFHFCDNNTPNCEEGVLSEAYKVAVDELYLPNRDRILAAVRLHVTRTTAVSVRVATTSPDLKIVASLYERSKNSPEDEALSSCMGNGELFWTPIGLEPLNPNLSIINLTSGPAHTESGTIRSKISQQFKKPGSASSRKGMKLGAKRTQQNFPSQDSRIYEIEVRAPDGWPLTTDQWLRVDEILNPVDNQSVTSTKKSTKPGFDDHRTPLAPNPGDASCCLEVAIGADSEVMVERYNKREQAWTAELESWERDARHAACALIRDEFRETHLDRPQFDTETEVSLQETVEHEAISQRSQKAKSTDETYKEDASSTDVPHVEERYLTRPEHLQEKFKPLEFLPYCTRQEIPENMIVLTDVAAEAVVAQLHERIEQALATTDLYDEYNTNDIIDRQKKRNILFDKLQIDMNWGPELTAALELRDSEVAVSKGLLVRNNSKSSKK